MNRPPCVLFLLDWHPVWWSTREEYYYQLCQRLTQQGIQPILTVSEVEDERIVRRFEAAGGKLLARSYAKRPFGYWNHIRQVVRQYSVRIIHIRFFDYFTAVHWMCRLSGIRTVIFTEANSGEWRRKGLQSLPLLLRTKIMCWPLRRVIAVSRYIRGRLVALGVPPDRIEVVYNGVDTSTFRPDPVARQELRERMHAGPDTIVLLYVSVFRDWKHPETALEICTELVRCGQDVQLWMAGLGPLRQSTEDLARQLGLDRKVHFLGHQPDPQRWMAAADVFLHTAAGEAFGNVLVEAMACGLPVAAIHSGATPELITGQSGILAAPGAGAAPELAAAIHELQGDRVRYQTMSEAGIRQAAHFQISTCVDRTLDVYRTLLA